MNFARQLLEANRQTKETGALDDAKFNKRYSNVMDRAFGIGKHIDTTKQDIQDYKHTDSNSRRLYEKHLHGKNTAYNIAKAKKNPSYGNPDKIKASAVEYGKGIQNAAADISYADQLIRQYCD